MRSLAALFLVLTLLPSSLSAQDRVDPPQPRGGADFSVPLGLYVACSEAFMHTEVLELARDSFFHYLSTDVPPETTTRGTYRVQGDTVIFVYEISAVRRSHRDFLVRGGRPPEELDEELFYPWRMFVDRLQGQPVLWRTRRIWERDRGRTPVHPYSVLIYAGPRQGSTSPGRSCRSLGGAK